ncbi:MAG TPA: hypothetical protein VK509_05455 [Polyangiales bacterium]|nr:hypothetical protein [Polyangiales bacterium]
MARPVVPAGARCAEHVALLAEFVCARCGDFGCAQCRRPGRLCRLCALRSPERASDEESDRIRAEIDECARRGWKFGVPGFALQVFGQCVAAAPFLFGRQGVSWSLGMSASALVSVVSVGLLVTGFGYYARMKNRSFLHGFWVFLSCLGVIIVVLLGKRCRRCASMANGLSSQCKTCTAPL